MKRINPLTNKPFVRGDKRYEDDKVFSTYMPAQPTNKNGFIREQWLSPAAYEKMLLGIRDWERKQRSSFEGRVKNALKKVKSRSLESGIPFDLTYEYLLEISVKVCPILGIELSWETIGKGMQPDAPSLDKIVPELGYVIGNVQWVSLKANMMKQNASFAELHKFADWVKNNIPK